MKEFDYVTNNEIAVDSMESAISLMEVLTDNGYVVMLSREEELYIINYVWTSKSHSDRNYVVFNRREKVEDFIYSS